MGENSGIQWTDDTWNPVTGCTKVSPACANCYIERTPPFRMAGRRFDGKGHIPLVFYPERLEIPLRKQRPRRYFVNSLSDLFHDDVPDTFIDQVFAVMALAEQHQFQVLTKRAARMRAYINGVKFERLEAAARSLGYTMKFGNTRLVGWPLRNVWLGVSAENQRMWNERVFELLQTDAWVRWVSMEPLLERVDMRRLDMRLGNGLTTDPLTGCHEGPIQAVPFPPRWPGIDWVVFGAESGPPGKIRALNLADLRHGLAQCRAVGVAAFVKQLGELPPYERLPVGTLSSNEIMASMRDRPRAAGEPRYSNWCTIHPTYAEPFVQRHLICQDRKGGDPAEWPADLRVREWPEVAS
jgi:protein gp37